jgi:hypothetical protein
MDDPWAISMSALALLGTLPNYIKNWENLFKKNFDKNLTGKKDFEEFKQIFLNAHADFLFHKIILLNTVIAFSLEHVMNKEFVEYCKKEIGRTKESLDTVRQQLSI